MTYTPSADSFYQQAYDYIYQRSIILAQDEALIAMLADDLRQGAELPRNQKAFRAFAERYVRLKLPIADVDEKYLKQMVDYYALIGQVGQPRPIVQAGVLIAAVLLLLAAIAGITLAVTENTSTEDISTAASAGRTVVIVGVVLGLYYWVSLKAAAVLAFVRMTLLLVLIIAMLWLLHDNGAIALDQLLNGA